MPLISVDGGEDSGEELRGVGDTAVPLGPRPAALGRAAKVAAVCASALGLAVCALAWKGVHAPPALRQGGAEEAEVQELDEISKHPLQVSTTRFNCIHNLHKANGAWSPEKKKWCCSFYLLGCEQSTVHWPWIIGGVALLAVVALVVALALLAVWKRKRDEEFRRRLQSQFESDRKDRRCCVGSWEKDEKSAWFDKHQEKSRGCTCFGDRDGRSKFGWFSGAKE
mmetsp:Transcript_58859/g.182866  ORF Transcript_58859/g.182866 Transcript_58859/m.182866 type:complete len:224 (-) Transcript_58859:309-980(-)